MYLVLGDINSILIWFNSRSNRSKFLCLLVAGHLRDLKFFQDVFEQRLVLDTISGPNIAVLLFTNDPGKIVSIAIGPGSYTIVPGQSLKDNGFANYPKNIPDIHNINPDTSQEIINASLSMANQICAHFGLRQKDIPCILVLSKRSSEPSVIPTRGEADVQAFYQFLKDLRKIADVLPDDFDPYMPLELARSLIEKGQLVQAIEALEKAELEPVRDSNLNG